MGRILPSSLTNRRRIGDNAERFLMAGYKGGFLVVTNEPTVDETIIARCGLCRDLPMLMEPRYITMIAPAEPG
jgi:hypothetical protein